MLAGEGMHLPDSWHVDGAGLYVAILHDEAGKLRTRPYEIEEVADGVERTPIKGKVREGSEERCAHAVEDRRICGELHRPGGEQAQVWEWRDEEIVDSDWEFCVEQMHRRETGRESRGGV